MKKIIVTGKGGTGKTTLAATLSRILSRDGAKVLAIDMDPCMNLAMSLGVPFSKLRTYSSEKELLPEDLSWEKTPDMETHVHNADLHLEQILDRFRVPVNDTLHILVTGRIPYGGAGCLCPSISLVKMLVGRISAGTDRYRFLIVDSQAGSEILGRGFAAGYDCNIVITEAFPKSIEVARHVLKLGHDLNIGKQVVVVNKVRSAHEVDRVSRDLELAKIPVFPIRFDERVAEADRWGALILDFAPRSAVEADIRALAASIREPEV
jgi:CO dehydrogenase maturation factor